MNSLCLDLAGVKVKFSTDFSAYYDYLSVYFDKVKLPDSTKEFDVEISFHWSDRKLNEYFADAKKREHVVEVGASTLISEDSVTTIKKLERRWKVFFDISTKGNKLKVETALQKKPIKDFFRFGPVAKPNHEFYFMITYHLLYYPVFWYLENYKQTHALHASALTFIGKGVVICGMEGVGKTSLGLKFLQEDGSQYLSDNLIFFDRKRVYPCYELVRMHSGDDNKLWEGRFEKVNDFNLLKDFFTPKLDVQHQGIEPDVVIFPEFSDKFFVTHLSEERAVNRAVVLSHLPAELRDYAEYRNLYNLLSLEFNPTESLYSVLSNLFSKTECYRVGMPKSAGLEANFERLKEEIFLR